MSKIIDWLETKNIQPRDVLRMTQRDDVPRMTQRESGVGRKKWVRIYYWGGPDNDPVIPGRKEDFSDELLVEQWDIDDASSLINRGENRTYSFSHGEFSKTKRKKQRHQPLTLIPRRMIDLSAD